MESLPAQDRRVVQRALVALPSRLEEAKQKEMGEMMVKLKEVCIGVFLSCGGQADDL